MRKKYQIHGAVIGGGGIALYPTQQSLWVVMAHMPLPYSAPHHGARRCAAKLLV